MALKEYGAVVKLKDEFSSELKKLLNLQDRMTKDLQKQQKLREKNSKKNDQDLKNISKQLNRTKSDYEALYKAGRGTINISAKDDASDDIQRISSLLTGIQDHTMVTLSANANDALMDINDVNGKVTALSGKNANITLTADANDAKNDINDINGKINSLSNKKTNIILTADANDAINDISDINSSIKSLSNKKSTIRLTADANDVLSDIEGIKNRVKELAGKDANITLTSNGSDIIFDIESINSKIKDMNSNAFIDIDTDMDDAINDLREVRESISDIEEVANDIDMNLGDDIKELQSLILEFRKASEVAELFDSTVDGMDVDIDVSDLDRTTDSIKQLQQHLERVRNMELKLGGDEQALKAMSNLSAKTSDLIDHLQYMSTIKANPTINTRSISVADQKLQNFKGKLLGITLRSYQITTTLKDNITSKLNTIKSRIKDMYQYSNNPMILAVRDKITPTIKKVTSRLKDYTSLSVNKILAVKDLASPTIKKVFTLAKSFVKNDFKTGIVAIDKATSVIKKILSAATSLMKGSYKISVGVLDKATSILKGIGGTLASMAKSVVIPVTATITGLVAGAKVGLSGLGEEQSQKLTIQRVIENSGVSSKSASSKTDEYYKYLEKMANSTPFDTATVALMGTKSMMIAQGDVKRAQQITTAMGETKAFVGDLRTEQEVAEAFFSANMGNMEMLNNMLGTNYESFAEALSGIEKNQGGLMDKMSTTIPGLLSTITGKLKNGAKEMVKPFTSIITKGLSKVVEGLDPMIQQSKIFAASVAVAFGADDVERYNYKVVKAITGIKDHIVTSLTPLTGAIKNFGETFASMLDESNFDTTFIYTVSGLFGKLLDSITTLVNMGTALLPSFGGIAIAMFSGVSGVANTFLDAVKNIANTITERMPQLSPIFEAFSQVVTVVWNIVTEAIKLAESIIIEVIDIISNNTQSLQSIIEFFGNVAKVAWELFSTAVQIAWDLVSPLFENVIKIVGNICDIFNDLFPGATDTFKGALELLSKPLEFFIGLVDKALGLVESLTGGIADMVDSIKRNGVIGAVGELIGIGGKSSKNAFGLQRVTKDGHRAVLHEGEMVLTKQQANVYERALKERSAVRKPVRMEANSNVTKLSEPVSHTTSDSKMSNKASINIAKLADSIIVREEADIDKFTNHFVDRLKEVVENYGGGVTV